MARRSQIPFHGLLHGQFTVNEKTLADTLSDCHKAFKPISPYARPEHLQPLPPLLSIQSNVVPILFLPWKVEPHILACLPQLPVEDGQENLRHGTLDPQTSEVVGS